MEKAIADIIVYSLSNSARLDYIVKLLFLGRASITNDVSVFETFPGTKINYSTRFFNRVDAQVIPHTLLFEKQIQAQQIIVNSWQGIPVFFETIGGSIPFDIFAASFYLITRYEEWLPHETDHLGRYTHQQSVAYQQGFLERPMVNIWMEKWALQNNLPYTKPAFTYRPSYDIDIAYSYLHHSVLRNIGRYFKDLLNANFSGITEKVQVLAGIRKDPYDVYDWLNQLHEQYQLNPIYFLLVAEKRDAFHKNISPGKKGMKQLIQSVAQKYEVGIHPSFPLIQATLQKEKAILETLIRQPVKQSRQHYIQISFPTTYEALLCAGITEDFSMGYPTFSGFRASYTGSFNWFHLIDNKETSLVIFPFCYMDATQIFHERNTPETARLKIEYYYQQFQQYGGCFIPIFHNQFLSEQSDFAEWRKVYADFCLRRL